MHLEVSCCVGIDPVPRCCCATRSASGLACSEPACFEPWLATWQQLATGWQPLATDWQLTGNLAIWQPGLGQVQVSCGRGGYFFYLFLPYFSAKLLILLQSDSARSNFAAAKIPKVQEACLKPQVTERSALPLDLHHAPPCALHLGELPHLGRRRV